MKQLLGIIFVLFLFSCSHSQSDEFKFDHTSIDLNTINVKTKELNLTFRAFNGSAKPVKIDTVLTSCGCTKPELNTKTVGVGDSLLVSVVYDPTNQLGRIDKYVSLVSGKDTFKLAIIGEVVPDLEEDVKLNYQKEIGCVKFKSTSINFGAFDVNQKMHNRFMFYNTCEAKIGLNLNGTAVRLLEESDSTLEGNVNLHSFSLEYVPVKDKFGYLRDTLYLTINEADTSVTVPVLVHANIIGGGEHLIDSLGAPKLKVDKMGVEFGKVTQGDTVFHTFKVYNKGAQDLKLVDVKPTCECVKVIKADRVVAPGGVGEIEVAFLSVGRSGYQRKTIVLLTNDPQKEIVQLLLNGKVVSN